MSMKYFSDKEGYNKGNMTFRITIDVWNGIAAKVNSLIGNNLLAKDFPKQCPDGNGICGVDEQSFYIAVFSVISGAKDFLPAFGEISYLSQDAFQFPFDSDGDDGDKQERFTYDVLDFIEFVYQHINDVQNGPYHDFFRFHIENDFPYNNSYDGWWGHDTLPKLNYEGSRDLTNYIMQIGKKWVSPPYNCDGWRLDVAADLGHSSEFNHAFWKRFRKAVREANPEAIIIAEHYGDAGPWLQGDEWDTIMNYDAFMEPVTWFLTGMEKHSDSRRDDLYQNGSAFFDIMRDKMAHLEYPSLLCAMNELSNHDHSRFLTRTNRMVGRINTMGSQAAGENLNKGVFREAVTLQMTWPGAPTVYYADEAGQVGWTDPDNRRTYPWGREDPSLIGLHRKLISLRKELPVLKTGSLKPLLADDASRPKVMAEAKRLREEEPRARDGVGKRHRHRPRFNFAPKRADRPEDRDDDPAGEDGRKSRVPCHPRRLAELMVVKGRREDRQHKRREEDKQRQRLRENLKSRCLHD